MSSLSRVNLWTVVYLCTHHKLLSPSDCTLYWRYTSSSCWVWNKRQQARLKSTELNWTEHNMLLMLPLVFRLEARFLLWEGAYSSWDVGFSVTMWTSAQLPGVVCVVAGKKIRWIPVWLSLSCKTTGKRPALRDSCKTSDPNLDDLKLDDQTGRPDLSMELSIQRNLLRQISVI